MRFADVFAVRVSLCGNFAYYFIGHVYSYSAGFGQSGVVGFVLILRLQTAT